MGLFGWALPGSGSCTVEVMWRSPVKLGSGSSGGSSGDAGEPEPFVPRLQGCTVHYRFWEAELEPYEQHQIGPINLVRQ
jgi:hypothetical protein